MRNPLFLVSLAVTVAAAANDWPQFHGPNRDNKSSDTGLLSAWPENGPERVWEASGIGEGYSSVSISGGNIYTAGAIERRCVVTALDARGNRLWAQDIGEAWRGSYPGTRSTPTIVGDRVYHLSGTGDLGCLDAASGAPVWSRQILKEFDGRNIRWGLAESPLVLGDSVICTPGGEEISVVALDRNTGEVVWTCAEVGDKPGYASPIVVDYQGLRQIVTAMAESIVGIRASDGKLLWRFPHKVYTDQNILTPVFHDGSLIISGCVRKGTTRLRLVVSGSECSVEEQWHNGLLDNKQGGIVLLDNRLYGYAESQQRAKPWTCLDFATGDTLFQSDAVHSSYKYRSGCLTYADGMFYLYSDDGNMALVKPLPHGFEVRGRLKLDDPGKNPTWAYPVVHSGRLYLRYGNKLAAYNVRDEAS